MDIQKTVEQKLNALIEQAKNPAAEELTSFGIVVLANGSLEAWLEALKTLLYHGAIDRLTQALVEAGVGDYSAYFRQHQRRMQYQEFWEAGYPIGSGAVESGVKRYKQRLDGPGMRWSRRGAERMTLLRSAVLSDDFDRLWDAA